MANSRERKQIQRIREKGKINRIDLKVPNDLYLILSLDAKAKNLTLNNLVLDCLLESYPLEEES
jgi:hypothetical protein